MQYAGVVEPRSVLVHEVCAVTVSEPLCFVVCVAPANDGIMLAAGGGRTGVRTNTDGTRSHVTYTRGQLEGNIATLSTSGMANQNIGSWGGLGPGVPGAVSHGSKAASMPNMRNSAPMGANSLGGNCVEGRGSLAGIGAGKGVGVLRRRHEKRR